VFRTILSLVFFISKPYLELVEKKEAFLQILNSTKNSFRNVRGKFSLFGSLRQKFLLSEKSGETGAADCGLSHN
jgi:hypothetical protein